jgi:hypothetical protein
VSKQPAQIERTFSRRAKMKENPGRCACFIV